MAINPFQQGERFETEQRARELAIEAGQRREKGIAALANEFGPGALAPAAAAQLRGQRAAQVRGEAATARTAQQDAIAAEDRDRKRELGVGKGIVALLKKARDNGIPLAEVGPRVAKPLAAMGFSEEETGEMLQRMGDDPAILDEVDAMINAGLKRKAVGKPVGMVVDGQNVVVQTYSDGSREVVGGGAELTRDVLGAGRLGVAQQRAAQREPEALGEAEKQKAIGKFMGETIAEDLPKSRRATAFGHRVVEGKQQRTALIGDFIDKALEQTTAFTGGFPSLLAAVPGTPQANLRETLQTIRANIGFQELGNLKAQSKAGGALGQVSEMENKLLQAVLGSLELSQTPKQLKQNLEVMKAQLKMSFDRVAKAFEEDFGVPYRGPGTPVPAEGASEPAAAKVPIGDLINKYAPQGN